MKYLIAPNAFKGTLTAKEAAVIIAENLGAYSNSKCIIQPIADGGDGTCGLIVDSLRLEKVQVLTLNAIGRPVLGYFGWDDNQKKAYLDVSIASGIGMLEPWQKNPELSSTYGTGLIIKHAIQLGAKEVILGLGGSATVDLGIGILGALGILFLDEDGREIPFFSPGFLKKIRHIQRTPYLPKIRITCLCDVKNLFLGSEGAIPVFGPQKGIQSDQIESFELDCLKVLNLLVRKSAKPWLDLPGYGAAGGIAVGLQSFFSTEIKFGADYFFELVGLEDKVKKVDWIITGEGQYDAQSDQGKASFALLQLAKANGKRIALVTSGSGGRGTEFDLVLELPALDFSESEFKEKARQNLSKLITNTFLEEKLN